MKRILACLLCVLLLAGCGADRPDEADHMVSIPEQMGLGPKSAAGEESAAFTLSTEWAEYDPSIGTIWFTLENHSGGDIETGVDHTLECYVEEVGAWYQVPMKADAAWNAIALCVPDGETIALSCSLSMFDCDFSGGGAYRIVKKVDGQICTAEFQLTPGSAISAETPYGFTPLEDLPEDAYMDPAARNSYGAAAVFTDQGASSTELAEEFLQKVSLGIPCQLRTVQSYSESWAMTIDVICENSCFLWRMLSGDTVTEQRFSYIVTDGGDIYLANGADWDSTETYDSNRAFLVPERYGLDLVPLVEQMTADRLAANTARYKIWSADGTYNAALSETPTEFSVGGSGWGESVDLQNWDGLETAILGVEWQEDGTLRLTCKTVTGETSVLRFDPKTEKLSAEICTLPPADRWISGMETGT